ncbi:MAG TPA: peroxiredoxin [Actinomycetes bacterium]|nr:peroxiredoxin [Actinomycetes bacterium]
MTAELGQEAPDFTLPNHHGEPVTLSSYRGKKNVVLIFYPWAFTGTCTAELCEIRERMPSFDNDDTVTFAISCDAKFSLRIYAEREDFEFDLLSDHWPHGATAKSYGVFNEKAGAANRGTFIIDKEGIIRFVVVNGIPDARDPGEYEKALAAL